MKKVNAEIAQQLILTIAEGQASEFKKADAKAEVIETMAGLHDRNEAIALGKFALEQAILQGFARVIQTKTGRNDTTSNWKRDLAAGVNSAYDNEPTRVVFKTKGKGVGRLVTADIVEKPKTDSKSKFLTRLKNLCSEVNATETERESIVGRFVELFDLEQERLVAGKMAAEQLANEARANAAEAITARVSSQLELAGIKATPANIKVAMAMQATA